MKRNGVYFVYFVISLFIVPWSEVNSDERLSYIDLVLGKQSSLNVENRNVITDVIVNGILNIYAPVSDAFDNDLCRNHSQVYKEAVKQYTFWALKMLDSSAKIPEGVFAGNLYNMGNYDECVQLEDLTSEFGSFGGQYCLVSLGPAEKQTDVRNFNGQYPIQFQEAISKTSTKVGGSLGGIIGLARWAICIPSSCRANDLQLHLNDVFRAVLGSGASFKVNDVACASRANPNKFTAIDWFAVGFISFFGLLVVLSTAYDILNRNSESRHSLLLAFSVYTNGRKLLSVGPANRDSLSAVHGVRVLSTLWVVFGHRYLTSTFYAPSINTFTALDYLTDWKHLFVTNAVLSVDSFLLLSGTLVCYIFLREMEKGARFNVLLYYLHRYVRLTPAFAVMMFMVATLLNYIDDGPFWNQHVQLAHNNCAESWWVSLLYVNNYVRIETQCLSQSWYLAVDMQLFWLSPLLLYPLWRWPKYGKLLGGLLLVVGLLVTFLVSYLYEFGYNSAKSDYIAKLYNPTHTRYTPWLLGIGLGYLLHHTKHTTLHLSPITVVTGWFLSAGLLLTIWLLPHRFMQLDHDYERAFESIYMTLFRPGWALVVSWVIFACLKGYGGFVNTFLSWNVFQVLGRLTYTVYLTHIDVILWIYGAVKTPGYISDSVIMTQYFGDVIITFTAAFVLSLVFESPAMVIEKYLLGKSGQTEQRQKRHDVERILKDTNTGKVVHQEQSTMNGDPSTKTGNTAEDLSNTTGNTEGNLSCTRDNTAGDLSSTIGNNAGYL